MAGPDCTNVSTSASSIEPNDCARRYCSAASTVNSLSGQRLWAGIHTMPPDTAVVPPTVGAFSYTSTDAPATTAVSAAVSAAAPLPSTTTSASWSQDIDFSSLQ